MSYAVCRMQKVKSAGLKGMQFHNQRERKSRTNDDIDYCGPIATAFHA
ncbi:plasmid recombination protein [Eggerthella guodeyinii]